MSISRETQSAEWIEGNNKYFYPNYGVIRSEVNDNGTIVRAPVHAKTGEAALKSFEGHAEGVTSVSFSLDGKRNGNLNRNST